MPRIVVLLIIVVCLALSFWSAANQQIGVNSYCLNGGCTLSATTSLTSVLISIALIVFLLRFTQARGIATPRVIVGIWRRFGAFMVDYITLLSILAHLGAFIILAANAFETGSFQWSTHRTSTGSLVNILLALVIFTSMFLMAYYFYKHAKSGRATLGQYIAGYRIVPADSPIAVPEYGMRTILSFVGMCAWPLSVYSALRKPDKHFWWDTATSTQVVRVRIDSD